MLEHGHGGDVQRVAHAVLKGADAPLAQNHLLAALGHDVFGAHHELLQRGGKTALEQHRLAHAAHRLEQLEVLHVPRAHLDQVHILEHGNVLGVHDLGHDGHAGFGPGMAQQLQALGPHALEGVGGGAGLEGAAAQKARAAGLHLICHQADLLLALHAAGTGDHREVSAADLGAADLDHGVLGVELAVGLFVGLRDAAHLVHRRIGQHPAFGHGLGVAHKAQNVLLFAQAFVDGKAHGFQLGPQCAYRGLVCVLFQNDNHTKTPLSL